MTEKRRSRPGVPAAMAMVLLLASCGGGDNDGAAATAAPDESVASPEIFCESVVAAEEAVLEAATGGEPAPIEPLLDRVADAAPRELAEEVDAVVSAVRTTLETRDDAPLRDPEFGENDERIDVWVADNCEFESVRVTAVDHAFEGMPRTLPAGIATFRFRNVGEEMHEMLTVRLLDRSIAAKDLADLSDEEAEEGIDYLGSAFAAPGEEDVDSRTLVAGRYALVCFIPVGATRPPAGDTDGPTHFGRGMWAEFVVR